MEKKIKMVIHFIVPSHLKLNMDKVIDSLNIWACMIFLKY